MAFMGLSGQVDSDTVILVLIGGLALSLSLWLLKNTTEIKLVKWILRGTAIVLIGFTQFISFLQAIVLKRKYLQR